MLDHLIVQKMDEDEGEENLDSILSFGAKALFEEDDANDIHCEFGAPHAYDNPLTDGPADKDQDVENLIEKLEQEEPSTLR